MNHHIKLDKAGVHEFFLTKCAGCAIFFKKKTRLRFTYGLPLTKKANFNLTKFLACDMLNKICFKGFDNNKLDCSVQKD